MFRCRLITTAVCIDMLAIAATPPAVAEVTCPALNMLLGKGCVSNVTARPGGTVVLASGITSLHSAADCTFNRVRVGLYVKPKIGNITWALVDKTVDKTDMRGNSGPCVGRKVRAMRISYQANRDARGEDDGAVMVEYAPGTYSRIVRYHIKIDGH